MPLWKRSEAEAGDDAWLVVGLGNPGPKYARSRHNAGNLVVQTLARRHGLSFRRSRNRAELARGTIDGTNVMLALPLTYMNESGYAVSHLVRYFHVPRHRLVVVCDEMDLPFGTLRIRPGGSSAGNRGLKSVITELGSQDFARLRVGVGRPRDSSIAHVLGEFPPEEAQVLPQLLDTAADAVTAILRDGTTAAMNAFNRDWLPELRPSSTA